MLAFSTFLSIKLISSPCNNESHNNFSSIMTAIGIGSQVNLYGWIIYSPVPRREEPCHKTCHEAPEYATDSKSFGQIDELI